MPRKRKPSGRGYHSRQVGNRELIQRFLIVCEGIRTEPVYFSGFRVPSVRIEVIGLGKDPLTLVEATQKRHGRGRYDQVWCVFDKDEVSVERFNQALTLAQTYGIRVAYSNQAFELWYLLHFHFYHTAVPRQEYINKLSGLLGRPYQKNDSNLYQELLPKQAEAIQNAIRLLEQYNPLNPADDDPSTTVHELVQQLNRFTQKIRFQQA